MKKWSLGLALACVLLLFAGACGTGQDETAGAIGEGSSQGSESESEGSSQEKIFGEFETVTLTGEPVTQEIFGEAYYERGSGSITVHVRHLREKMGDSFEDPRYIKTVWGLGYKIER